MPAGLFNALGGLFSSACPPEELGPVPCRIFLAPFPTAGESGLRADLVSCPVQAHGVVLPLRLFLLIQGKFLPFLLVGVPKTPSTPALLSATAPGNC